MAELECRHFGGYKPCARSRSCDRAACASFRAAGPRVLFVHLGALGAVLRSTSLIPAIRRRYPDCVITWVTAAPPALIRDVADRTLSLGAEDQLRLRALEFDVGFVVDKDLAAVGVLKSARVERAYGFTTDPRTGAIVPATPAATELWNLGLSDHDKFFVNRKSEQQLTHEALELGPYKRDDYRVVSSAAESAAVARRRTDWGPGPIIGLNTGCSPALPAKKLSVAGHRELIETIRRDSRLAGARIVLLGGPEDSERNRAIADGFPDVVASPTDRGLRDGMISVAACDLVFSGDSLGMHMAIALRKWVVAWFGPSCAHEIDLYDRGVKLLSKAPCAPCWKRVCEKQVMCYDQVDFFEAVDALAQGLTWLTSSSKPHFPETSSSPYP